MRVLGYHDDNLDQSPGFDGGRWEPVLASRPDGAPGFSGAPAHSLIRVLGRRARPGSPTACQDGGANDPYPNIINCPVPFYRVGGVGFLQSTNTKRYSGVLSVTQRVTAAGHHIFKAGVDLEDQSYNDSRLYTGGGLLREQLRARSGPPPVPSAGR